MRKPKVQKALEFQSTGWNTERIHIDGDEYYEALESSFASAKESIDFEVYIYSQGPLGRRIAESLQAAARRGVRVRIIVDGIGSAGWAFAYGDAFTDAGAKFKVYHELPWEKWPKRRPPGKRRAGFVKLLSRVNSRDHRKLIIIDSVTAFVGSFNITEEHSRKEFGDRAWRDTAAQVSGEEVQLLKLGFEFAWLSRARRLGEWGRNAKKLLGASPLVRLNVLRRQRKKNYAELLERMLKAKARIWITTAYFVPDSSLLTVLEHAAQAGIDVRIVVPARSDVFFIPWVSSALQYGLLKAGVRVFQYLPSMLHAKTLLIDDWCLIGSSNLNHRSLLHDLEADVVVTHRQSLDRMERAFTHDVQKSQAINLEAWSRRPRLERWAGKVLLAFRGVM